MSQNMEHRMRETDIRNAAECMPGRDITSFTSSLPLTAKGDGAPPQSAVAVADGAEERPFWTPTNTDDRPEWTTPVLVEQSNSEKARLKKIGQNSNPAGNWPARESMRQPETGNKKRFRPHCKTAAEQKCAVTPSRRHQKRTSGHG